MKRAAYLAMGAAGAASVWAAWSRAGRAPPRVPVDVALEARAVHGEDAGCGSLIAMQPCVSAGDYASADRLLEKLDLMFRDAQEHGVLSARTVVVLPEHLATWLVSVDEKRAVYDKQDMAGATALIIARNLPRFARYLVRAPAYDKAAHALFRCKARAIVSAWRHVAQTLARRYGVTLVAGTGLLPAPRARAGAQELVVGDGPLAHVALVFGPDGALLGPATAKCFLGPDERGFVSPGAVAALPIYETPAGRLGVLIGRDSFQPEAYGALFARGLDILAVPAYLGGERAWTRPWSGFVGDVPQDADADDEGRLLEAEAWLKWAAPRRCANGAVAQVTSFLKGRVWDRSSDGAALTTAGGVTSPGPLVPGGSWVCQWLPASPRGEGARSG